MALFFIDQFIFGLHWVFPAARRFSLVGAVGGYCLVLVCGLLIVVASLVEHGPQGVWAQQWWGMGLVAPRHVESSQTRDRAVSLALANGFLTTGPPGKSDNSFNDFFFSLCNSQEVGWKSTANRWLCSTRSAFVLFLHHPHLGRSCIEFRKSVELGWKMLSFSHL